MFLKVTVPPPTNNKGHNDSKIYLCVYRYINLIELKNSSNLATLN